MFILSGASGPTSPSALRDHLAESETPEQGVDREVTRLLKNPRLFDRIGDAIRALGYVGNVLPALLACVALTSRLLAEPMNLNFVAESSTGKSFTVDKPLELMPPEAYYFVRASSPRALIYCDEEFEHRVVVFAEADSIPEGTRHLFPASLGFERPENGRKIYSA